MKFAVLLALLASLTVGCIGTRPLACVCLEVRVTGGANNTPLSDVQFWVIDAVNGDRQISEPLFVGGKYYLTEDACSTTQHEFEVRRAGYVSQRFSHRSSVERGRCDPPPPPDPPVTVQLQAQ